jgi:F-type H+/Na+-transporting ATPase subunit alpha
MQEFVNTGKVIEVKDGIVIAEGLSNTGYNEIVTIHTQFSTVPGLVLSLSADEVGIIVLGDYKGITAGNLIESHNEKLSIRAGSKLLGQVINPLGESVFGDHSKIVTDKDQGSKDMPLEKIAPGVIERKNINRPLFTGIKAIDSMFPIGRGQRELIIGDRQTGKTAIAVDTILNQKGKDVKCIYVSIGQKQSKIAQLYKTLKVEGAMEYTTIVAANASDQPSLQYIAPFAGCAIGEYFAERGEDALIIYDDLTKHAWAYREISLLLRRPPGREAYPGDIFYLHSRLLERALQYGDKQGGGSLTALPIIETLAGDVSSYIPTNIISITDGQIYLESDLFYSGQKPGINIGLSVSRVGGDAQLKGMKQIASPLKLALAQYNELAAFAQIGTDLDEDTAAKLERGKRIMEILKQDQYSPLPASIEACIIFAAINGYLDKLAIEDLRTWEEKYIRHLNQNAKEFLNKIEKGEKVENELKDELVKNVEASLKQI